MRFEKEIISGDKLKMVRWEFHLFDNLNYVLDSYSTWTKESMRNKKWTRVKMYSRLFTQKSNIKEDEVPIPEHICNSIREFVNNNLKVKRWSEYKTLK